MNDIRLDITKLIWYRNDPPTGDFQCLCSSCAKPISKNDVAIRLVCGPCHKQLRFHKNCYGHWFIDPIMGIM